LRCAGLFSTSMRCARPRRRELECIMLDLLKNFLSCLAVGDKHPDRFAENDYRLAAAALLIHAATIDGGVDAPERDKLHGGLQRHFGLDDAATAGLLDHGTRGE